MRKPETWCSLDGLELTEIHGSSFGQKPQIFWLKYFRLNGQGRDNLVYCLFILHYNLLYFKRVCMWVVPWLVPRSHARSMRFGSLRVRSSLLKCIEREGLREDALLYRDQARRMGCLQLKSLQSLRTFFFSSWIPRKGDYFGHYRKFSIKLHGGSFVSSSLTVMKEKSKLLARE